MHQKLQFWSCNYIDDFGSAEYEDIAWESYYAMEKLLTEIGVQEAMEKSVPPSMRMEFLGNIVDTIKMTIEVSEERRQELDRLLTKWLVRRRFSKKTTSITDREAQFCN